MRHSQLEFDFDAARPVAPPCARQRRGRVNFHAGLAAEASVERMYAARGCQCLERRWRGPGGEVDLIFRENTPVGDRIVFVEVKAAASHDAAAARIGQRQADRIAASAMAYLDRLPGGALTDMRLDVALVDGQGRVSVLENAFAGWW